MGVKYNSFWQTVIRSHCACVMFVPLIKNYSLEILAHQTTVCQMITDIKSVCRRHSAEGRYALSTQSGLLHGVLSRMVFNRQYSCKYMYVAVSTSAELSTHAQYDSWGIKADRGACRLSQSGVQRLIHHLTQEQWLFLEEIQHYYAHF